MVRQVTSKTVSRNALGDAALFRGRDVLYLLEDLMVGLYPLEDLAVDLYPLEDLVEKTFAQNDKNRLP